MRRFWDRKLSDFIRITPGLFILLSILGVISAGVIKSEYYLLGWDNYSSYFNFPVNLWRTIFATWRDYRGFGVPSDSESVDLYRQIFNGAWRMFALPLQVSDQLYYLLCLISGTVGMYLFVRKLLRYIKADIHGWVLDLVATAAGTFYLFNLNTFATFYFPIVTYNTRFSSLPLLFWSFLTMVTDNTVKPRKMFIIIAVFLFTSGSYITATVFVTTLMALVLFSLFIPDKRRVVSAFGLFIGCNLFWLLPFVNYSLEKAPLIRHAPTFVEANETQLNKPVSFYDPVKQLILYPNFFDTTFRDMKSQEMRDFHPLARKYRSFPVNISLSLFPVLYILGSVSIIFGVRKYRRLLWVPMLIAIFIFLTLKQYSPLGMVYELLDRYVPYFGVLFRFGDTKFHVYIAFAGAIAASVALVLAYHRLARLPNARWLLTGITIAGILLVSIPFGSYFTGNLIGPFIYTKVPKAYFEAAGIINADQEYGRVLHLPYDKSAYWRSYSWGALGSAFFQYMIDKPLFEKTFEPASPQNVQFDETVSSLVWNARHIVQPDAVRARAQTLARVLQSAGVSYVLLDETISSDVPSRGVTYWGQFDYADAKILLDRMESDQEVIKVGEYPILLAAYLNAYPDRFEITEDISRREDIHQEKMLTLYRLKDPENPVSTKASVSAVDPLMSDTYSAIVPESYIQYPDKSGTVFPFLRRDAEIESSGSWIRYNIPFVGTNGTSVMLRVPGESDTGLVDVWARRDTTSLVLTFRQLQSPDIGNTGISSPLGEIRIPLRTLDTLLPDSFPLGSILSDWHTLGTWKTGNLRVVINDVIMPLPDTVSNTDIRVGTALVHGPTPQVSVLGLDTVTPLTPADFGLTTIQNCYEDKIAGYSGSYDKLTGRLNTQDGTTCVIADLKPRQGASVLPYFEVSLTLAGISNDQDWNMLRSDIPGTLSVLRDEIKPGYATVCLQGVSKSGNCLNRHRIINIPSRSTVVRIPADTMSAPDPGTKMLFAAGTLGYQSQSVTLGQGQLYQYKSLHTEELPLQLNNEAIENIRIPEGSEIEISIPKVLSESSFYVNPSLDGWLMSNRPCGTGSYRTVRQVGDRLVSGIDNCYNEIFQTVPFYSSAFLLWNVNYSLMSGKFPQFVLKDRYMTYFNEYLSLYQGYPDIPGFMMLSQAELLPADVIRSGIAQSPPYNAYTFVQPRPEYEDTRAKDFIIHQDSQNVGLMAIDGYDILELPTSWQGMSLTPQGIDTSEYAAAEILESMQLLPSLWQVKVAAERDPILLKFNSGFDRQWRAGGSLLEALSGSGTSVSAEKCDGYANCFKLTGITGEKTLYLFYTPETLNFLGWGMTLFIIAVYLFAARRSLRSS